MPLPPDDQLQQPGHSSAWRPARCQPSEAPFRLTSMLCVLRREFAQGDAVGFESPGRGRLGVVPNVFIAGPVSWNLLIHTQVLPPPQPHTLFAQWYHETVGGTS